MSTEMTSIESQLPAELRDIIAQRVMHDIARIGAIGGKDTIRITQDKQFDTPGGETVSELEVVIVDFVYHNEYYMNPFNRKQLQSPACFAISPDAGMMRPAASSPLAQHTDCTTCQQNQFGSSPTGDGKACKNMVFLAVIPAGADKNHPVWVIKTPPTSIKPFNAYAARLVRDHLPTAAVVTKVFFDKELKYPSIRFEQLRFNMDIKDSLARESEARARLEQEPDTSTFELPTPAAGKNKR